MNGIKRLLPRLSLLLALVLVIAPACEDDFESSIPYVEVYFSINLVNHNELYTVGYPAYFGGGYGGIIIINNGSSYYAYDGACPYDIDSDCRIEEDYEPIGTCPCCGTKYNLIDGAYTLSGPSGEPLKQYRVTQSGSTLIITN